VDDRIIIYTDGACLGNPGPGGYGAVQLYQGKRRELSGGYRRTTNNRMELMGAIAALEALKARSKVLLYTDSRYVVDAVEKGWAQKWRRNGWRKPDKQMAMNPDLWERLLTACSQHEVRFEWVKGHAGNVENERCDVLANAAAAGQAGQELAADPGYGN
jgi:ribonuclease HI